MNLSAQKSVLFMTGKLALGGSEKKAIKLANNLSRIGYNAGFSYFVGNTFLERTISKSVNTFSAGQKGKVDLCAMLRYRKFVASNEFGCVISMGFYAALLHKICMSGSGRRPKEIISLNMSIPTPKTKRRLPIYKALLGNAHIIYGAKSQQQIWESIYRFKSNSSEVIYNGVDLDMFSPESDHVPFREKYGFKNNDIVIGVVAALRPEKAIQDFISASSVLHDQGLPIKLLIVGEGPQVNFLKNKVEQECLQNHTSFAGVLGDVRPALSAMDIFVLPSTSVETFSNAALEAMAMGLPVVLSDVGGAKEMVSEGENGFIFQPGNIDELVFKINKMINGDLYKKMGLRARQIVEDNFSLADMLKAYRRIIDCN